MNKSLPDDTTMVRVVLDREFFRELKREAAKRGGSLSWFLNYALLNASLDKIMVLSEDITAKSPKDAVLVKLKMSGKMYERMYRSATSKKVTVSPLCTRVLRAYLGNESTNPRIKIEYKRRLIRQLLNSVRHAKGMPLLDKEGMQIGCHYCPNCGQKLEWSENK